VCPQEKWLQRLVNDDHELVYLPKNCVHKSQFPLWRYSRTVYWPKEQTWRHWSSHGEAMGHDDVSVPYSSWSVPTNVRSDPTTVHSTYKYSKASCIYRPNPVM
jgi:hypothetical protein